MEYKHVNEKSSTVHHSEHGIIASSPHYNGMKFLSPMSSQY